jgi:dipeptidyl aminopeptidase/acylaminoacyl peptidase
MGAGAVAAPPPAEDFARLPEYENVQISPDGKAVALLHHESRGGVVLIYNVAEKRSRRFESWTVPDGDTQRPTAGIRDFRWLTAKRMMFQTDASYRNDYTYAQLFRSQIDASFESAPTPPGVSADDLRTQFLLNNAGPLRMAESELKRSLAISGFFAVNLDGTDRAELPGLSKDAPAGPAAVYHLWDPATLRVSQVHPGSVFMNYARNAWSRHPQLGRFDLDSGSVFVAAENPGMVDEWLLDSREQPRLGVECLPKTTKLWHKPADTKKWVQLADLGVRREQVRFHGFDASGKTLYISRSAAEGPSALYGYNLTTREWGEPQLRDREHDVAPADHTLSFGEAELTAPVFSPRTHDLVGVRYVADRPRQVWFEAKRAAVQRALDAARPGQVNMIVSTDMAEDRFVVLSWSARSPGHYGLFDLKTSSYTPLASRMGWIKPAEMGETTPFHCKAADGFTLEGYITKPADATNQRDMPLVVLLRENPWQRDMWGFDPWVQFLATRGYAVLQVNHRGSYGYGSAFHAAGVGEIDRAIQQDIEAAVQWAIDGRLADPKRVAIVGRGAGGTGALLALAQAGARYRCGVAIDAVADWVDTLKKGREAASRYWMESLDLFPADVTEQRLREASPATQVEKVTAPLLLIHPENSEIAPTRGTKALAAALEKTGHKPEMHFYAPDRSRAGTEKNNAEILRRLETFLAANLKPLS